MKFYKPLFSIVVILIQLCLSILAHFNHMQAMEKLKTENPELYELIDLHVTYDFLFLFVLVIGFYEMTTSPSLIKTLIQIFLVCIILGAQFSEIIPIKGFYYGVYNTAWFSSGMALVLILVRIGKYSFEEVNYWKSNKYNR
ncbi:hypothetical protein [Seonamhaeicola marinus]|uniref:Uncharacterized protein n=1 Tax=Seonamhaeicola marinus TaxID=1912246 RepID=A0A5D0IMV2_9FLAO|nr:hypothetical protein [Seonamhaeicola marinus]TYA84240.1 hypothetical protein FUA24_06215 [Seonamhaeicola marinus]